MPPSHLASAAATSTDMLVRPREMPIYVPQLICIAAEQLSRIQCFIGYQTLVETTGHDIVVFLPLLFQFLYQVRHTRLELQRNRLGHLLTKVRLDPKMEQY
jgi:hypothetical protein